MRGAAAVRWGGDRFGTLTHVVRVSIAMERDRLPARWHSLEECEECQENARMRGGFVNIAHVSINRGGGIRMLLPRERALVGGALSLLYWMAEHYYQCPRVTQITTKKSGWGAELSLATTI